MATLHDVVTEFVARRGIRPPAMDQATGGFALAIGGRYIVHVQDLGEDVVAWAWLGDLPGEADAREAIMRRLLRAELASFGSDDVVLSVDEDTAELHLHGRRPRRTLDAAGLGSLLQSLVDCVERRRPLLSERRASRPLAPLIIRP